MRKAEKIDWLQEHYLREWTVVRQQVFDELADAHDIFCTDKHLATGTYLSGCKRFNNKVVSETLHRLSHLLPKGTVS